MLLRLRPSLLFAALIAFCASDADAKRIYSYRDANGVEHYTDRPPQDAADHVGLRIMRERAASIDAALDIASVAGAGTSVTLTLPRLQPVARELEGERSLP